MHLLQRIQFRNNDHLIIVTTTLSLYLGFRNSKVTFAPKIIDTKYSPFNYTL